jgi:ADP-ribose pyrophosphatase YjhB (NUDIX family)
MTSKDTRHLVNVAGVVIDEDERALLIQRRDNVQWKPPCGILERNEAITQAYGVKSGKGLASLSSLLASTRT